MRRVKLWLLRANAFVCMCLLLLVYGIGMLMLGVAWMILIPIFAVEKSIKAIRRFFSDDGTGF